MEIEMINKSIEDFKVDHLKWIEKKMLNDGEISPLICILSLKKDEDKMGVVYAPIIGDFGDQQKEDVVKKVIPHLFKKIKDEGLVPYCFSFCSEVFLRKMSTEGIDISSITSDMIKDLPKTEALLVTFETKETTSTRIFDMERLGKSINKDGEMVDQIKLTVNETGLSSESTGRFTNIFKQYAE